MSHETSAQRAALTAFAALGLVALGGPFAMLKLRSMPESNHMAGGKKQKGSSWALGNFHFRWGYSAGLGFNTSNSECGAMI